MTIAVIILAVLILVALAVALGQRRAKANAQAQRQQAQEHRDEARATQLDATRQEAKADAMHEKAKSDLVLAEQQRNAAAVKREVAEDLNVRADNIDPDVPVIRS